MVESFFTPTPRATNRETRKRSPASSVSGNLAVRFNASRPTSFAGLELVRRFLRRLEIRWRLRRHLMNRDAAGDYRSVSIVRLILGMMMVGVRRLWHVHYGAGDPAIARLCGLRVLPGDRTLSR